MHFASAPPATRARRRTALSTRARLKRIGVKLVVYLLLTLVAAIAVIPFLWMATTAIKTTQEAGTYPPSLWPATPQWHNLADVFSAVPFLSFLRNTVLYATAVTLGQLAFCSTAAYAFARLKFPGRDRLFFVYLATLMIPGAVTLVPSFLLMKWFGWLNTVWVMTIPGMFGSAFGTFLLRQFMLTIPRELDEAATIDGASLFRIYWQLILPLSKSSLTVLAVLTIIAVWNDFTWPLVMLTNTSSAVTTLTLGLAVFATGGTNEFTSIPLEMAAATMTVAPLILIFFFAQRYFERGIVLTGFGGR